MKEIHTYQKSNSDPEHLDENQLAQYAEYLRDETRQIPEKLIDHVASCSYCRAELMAITDLLDTLPDLASEPDLEEAGYQLPVTGYQLSVGGSRGTTVNKWLRAVAAVAAVFLLVWIVQRLLPDRLLNESVATVERKDSLPNPNPDTLTPNLSTPGLLASPDTHSKSGPIHDTVLYAAAYVPNPVFESLVGAKYRSGADPKVTDPAPGKVFATGDTLRLSWTPDPEDEYFLVILDNKANSVREIKLGSSGGLAWKISLKPGLYYWKFLGKEEMWKVGRMKIIGSASPRCMVRCAH